MTDTREAVDAARSAGRDALMQGLLARHVNADEVDTAINSFLSKLSESHCIVQRDLIYDMRIMIEPGPRRDGESDDTPRVQRAVDFGAMINATKKG
jgi:hypothetical protein